MKSFRNAFVLLACLFTVSAFAQVPQLLNYQGRVSVGTTNFDGSGAFKFALVNSNGTVTLWSNDGTSAGGSQPTASVNLTVVRGLYSVLLGDTTVAGMTLALPSTVFTNFDVRLRVWFNDGVTGFQQFSPDQRIAAVGYALMGANVPDGAITSSKLANNSVTAGKIAAGAVFGTNIANGSITSNQLATATSLGSSGVNGQLYVYSTLAGTPGVSLLGNASQISTYGSDGLEQVRLWGPTYGEVLLNDNTGNDTTVNLSANNNNGGSLTLLHSNGSSRVSLSASSAAGDLSLYGTNGVTRTRLHGGTDGSYLNLYTADGNSGVYLDGDETGAGEVRVRNTNGSSRVYLEGLGNAGGGQVVLYANDNSASVNLYGDGPTTSGGGQVSVNNSVSEEAVRLSGHSSGGRITVFDESGATTLMAGASSVAGGYLQIYKANGGLGLNVDGDNNNAGYVAVYGTNGSANIILNGNSSGDGRIICDVLQINGGADLSERFDITSIHQTIKPGMIVSINPDKPGDLLVSQKAYDRTVAGIISGAGGVRPGMLMGQTGTKADGQHPVALTGRVYCYVDADAGGAVEPGDLITTSSTAGHGMKVTDHAKASGAIIGKAMSKLQSGKGLVLVLVSLQ